MFIRGIAAFVGLLTLFDLAVRLIRPGFECTPWWIDLRGLPLTAGFGLLLASAVSMLLLASGRALSARGRIAARVVLLLLAAVAISNVWQFYRVRAAGRIDAWPVPFSGVIAGTLIWMAWEVGRGVRVIQSGWWSRGRFAAGFAFGLLGLPLGLICFFGSTDYRRPADAAVVFGARTGADGRPSLALEDRVRTACDLYRRGLVRVLVFSGGPGDGSVHETDAMRQLSLSLGVPDDAILLDQQGLNTEATVRNTEPLFRSHGVRTVLAVSHDYHLPRIKQAYKQAGREVYTVPAVESRPLMRLPFFVAREVAAIWAYYGRGVLRGV